MNSHATVEPAQITRERLRLWLKLLKASRHVETEIRRRMRAEFNWTLPRFDVMAALARTPEGLKMSGISNMLKVSNGNVTVIVDKLVEEGLALREAVPGDRRASVVKLTDEGRAVFADHAAVHATWIDEILGGLSHDDVEGMNLRLDNLTAHLDQIAVQE